MPKTIATAHRVLELAETMRTTDKSLLAYWDAAHEMDAFRAGHLLEEVCREYLRLRDLETTTAGTNDNDLRLMPTKPRPV